MHVQRRINTMRITLFFEEFQAMQEEIDTLLSDRLRCDPRATQQQFPTLLKLAGFDAPEQGDFETRQHRDNIEFNRVTKSEARLIKKHFEQRGFFDVWQMISMFFALKVYSERLNTLPVKDFCLLRQEFREEMLFAPAKYYLKMRNFLGLPEEEDDDDE